MPKLTDLWVEAFKPESVRREVPDSLVPGLYFVVQPSGARSWAVRYRAGGKPRKYTIDGYPKIKLGPARNLARLVLVAVAEGRDPGREKIEARRASADEDRAQRDLVEKIVPQFVERYAKAKTRESSWRETERLLNRDVVPTWKGRRVQDISRRDVIELLDKIVDRGSPIVANRVLAAIRRMFGWCVERTIIETSPCTGVKPPSGENARDRVLSDDELMRVWKGCDALSWPTGPLVKLLVLTGQRRDEVAEMTWAEVDLEKRLWIIPKERAKNNVAHVVPLSTQATEILKELPRIKNKAGLVFCTRDGGVIRSFLAPKRRLDAHVAGKLDEQPPDEPPAHWTLHDLRRTVATGMARLGVHLPVIEKVLNHVSGSFGGIVAVYQRHSFADEKKAALDVWGRHISELTSKQRKGQLLRLRA